MGTMKTGIAVLMLAALMGCDGGDPASSPADSGAAGAGGAAGEAAGSSGGAGTGSQAGAASGNAGAGASGSAGSGAGGESASGAAGATAGASGSSPTGAAGATSYLACPAKTDSSDCAVPSTGLDRKKDGFICSPCSLAGAADPVGCVTGDSLPRLCVRDCSECQ